MALNTIIVFLKLYLIITQKNDTIVKKGEHS